MEGDGADADREIGSEVISDWERLAGIVRFVLDAVGADADVDTGFHCLDVSVHGPRFSDVDVRVGPWPQGTTPMMAMSVIRAALASFDPDDDSEYRENDLGRLSGLSHDGFMDGVAEDAARFRALASSLTADRVRDVLSRLP